MKSLEYLERRKGVKWIEEAEWFVKMEVIDGSR